MGCTLGDADEAVAHDGRFRYNQWGLAHPADSYFVRRFLRHELRGWDLLYTPTRAGGHLDDEKCAGHSWYPGKPDDFCRTLHSRSSAHEVHTTGAL